MKFDLSNNWGTLSPAANLAHEFGHAFGLIHEHQKPSAWVADPTTGRSTPLLKFYCENLADFGKVIKDRNEAACTSLNVANERDFSAKEFLAYPAFSYNGMSPAFDWQSIMLYSSHAGGKLNWKKPGRRTTLTRWNGDEIRPNLDPSALDGAAIQLLCPPAPPPAPAPAPAPTP
ncbi:hypothetical protein EJ08DRAFT_213267 [Tothia fuscella]|uniref:Peptidase M12A domain-containing protein n=1 Tax=Tothia fuscella TaxID=1048955 RepID=A0A9P4NSX6_9PEZI|nr:hypothetical protein EJ08DRAFT_213267 [Tothia fuscella]